ncbi:MAG: type II toxin-antitoxin system HicA family toxin [Candidatus Cloacimonetes bacterium]|nr:type II toxin-antitoxin system HicA family toxin [Candidatus Cloacimonadota bacterium]
MKPNELIKFLEQNGYQFIRASGGSHHVYSDGNHSVSIPVHKGKDFNLEFILLILRETGIKKDELLKFLKR